MMRMINIIDLANLLARRAGYGYAADRIDDLHASKISTWCLPHGTTRFRRSVG